MEADDPLPYFNALAALNIRFQPFDVSFIFELLVLFLMLLFSALISGSEVAFFSLSPTDIRGVKGNKSNRAKLMIQLHSRPNRLLATILVANNLVNVGIVILAAFISNSLIDFSGTVAWLAFLIQVVAITFLLLLFGEILPKIYANVNAVRFALFMSFPLKFLIKVFYPVSSVLIRSTAYFKTRISKTGTPVSMDDISDALDLPATEINEDEKILRGIATFGNIAVSEIMKSRIDVISADINLDMKQLLGTIIESGYSRIPIFEESFDNIRGILYIKDLLPYIDKEGPFEWQSLVRPAYIVPEIKKINDLLEEFQTHKIHMAVVVDEYGGSQGIVTLEDILEEIVGEIGDEFDAEESFYSKVDDTTYLFEGKTLLNDFCKIMEVDPATFSEIKGDADTLAGLILEIRGEIPSIHEVIIHQNFIFNIDAVDNRRIKKIRVTLK